MAQIEEETENQLINEEYKIWKKNVPYLYDLLITHELEWPSLTVQWLPTQDKQGDYIIHKLILGTHTENKEPNFLMIAKVRLPNEDAILELNETKDNNNVSSYFSDSSPKVDIETKIIHDGEINRARYNPHKFNVIATKTVSGEIHIFDYTRHGTKPINVNDPAKPQLRCLGHEQEGYGLSWNLKKEGYLLSGSNDGKDVSWHKFNQNVFGSVGDDKIFSLWDIRTANNSVGSFSASTNELYTLDFSPFNENLVIFGGNDRKIYLFDIRNPNKKIHTFCGHSDEIIKVEFSPFNIGIFGSCSSDKRAIVWDMSKIKEENKKDDAQESPPELLVIFLLK